MSPSHPVNDDLSALLLALRRLDSEMRKQWVRLEPKLQDLSVDGRRSAENLIHYVTLRRHDIRGLQEALARNGFSSLGRAESHVSDSLRAVLRLLELASGDPQQEPNGFHNSLAFDEGRVLLKKRTQELLGQKPKNRNVRIMVTMPRQAATDYALVRDLVAGGMDCMRINCAHDSAETWARMILNLKRAREEIGRPCRICMDVAGPKLRTGPIEEGPQVLKWRPARDTFGRVTRPVHIWLTPDQSPEISPNDSDVTLTLSPGFLARLECGDCLKLDDARGASRKIRIVKAHNRSWRAECSETTYVTPGTKLRLKRALSNTQRAEAFIGPLPSVQQSIVLHKGSRLILTRDLAPGKLARISETGQELEPARISCTLPEVFNDVREGQPIWFDDGLIGGTISSVRGDSLEVEITHAKPCGEKLAADKGINLPDSDLKLPSLTEKDLEDLEFIVKNADLVGYSFVRKAADVKELQRTLRKLGRENLGIVLKIETQHAFEQLPEILLASLRSRAAGVMIARGDLAVESGFERMAEVQEEIMWLCEAAHMPVIWATQVLEQLSKQGKPSRAEITDAAMSERAECVMLNKGPFVVDAVRTLDDILVRMGAHQEKKTAMLRHLRLADEFLRRH